MIETLSLPKNPCDWARAQMTPAGINLWSIELVSPNGFFIHPTGFVGSRADAEAAVVELDEFLRAARALRGTS